MMADDERILDVSDFPAQGDYEPPQLERLGTIWEITRGSSPQDQPDGALFGFSP